MSTYKQRQQKEVRKIADTIDETDKDLYPRVTGWSLPIRLIIQAALIGLTISFLYYIGGSLQ